MVLLYMVCHGSHQYTPFMLAYYIPYMDPMGYVFYTRLLFHRFFWQICFTDNLEDDLSPSQISWIIFPRGIGARVSSLNCLNLADLRELKMITPAN